MKNARVIRLVILFLTASSLSACLLVPVDGEYRRGNFNERDRGGDRGGDHRGDRHEGSGERR
ncbi:MAG: hypothetical protein PHY09_12785 [Desulfuromonadaceae bacterium]|nr:hypothetical protein [Desulfuromonadaceae bacterium]MDD5106880.1 hypothetical protein [Desulfuromonadaceae bacterium]